MNDALFSDMQADQAGRRTDSVPAAEREPRLRRPHRSQLLLEPVCLDERLPTDHPARAIWRVVQQLDLSAFYDTIVARGSDPGRPATDPKLLVALWTALAYNVVHFAEKLVT